MENKQETTVEEAQAFLNDYYQRPIGDVAFLGAGGVVALFWVYGRG